MTNNFGTRLNRFLPSNRKEALQRIVEEAVRLDMPVYLVGGFVRDLLRDKPASDYDVVVEGDATKLARSLSQRLGGRATVHAPFKTATWFPSDANDFIDLTSARSETYAHPAALPTVTLGTLTDDLHRRDFTVNAMAIRLDGDHFGELIDPLGGQNDLESRLIRVLHPRSFVDDPTRIFRAVRYAGRFGFQLAPETKSLIPDALHYVGELSPERLRRELDLILSEESPASMLVALAELGVFSVVNPPVPEFDSARRKLLGRVPPAEFGLDVNALALSYSLWFMDMEDGSLAALAERLYFTSSFTKIVRSAARLARDIISWSDTKPSEWTERLDEYPPMAIYAVYLARQIPQLAEYLKTWRHVKPTITGNDLKKLGLVPGPRYREILSSLRSAWLDGEVKTDGEERKLVEVLIRK